ncbi:MAG: hypothetical protein ABII64_04330 [Elusimicrobiota bacterium]
MANSFNKCKTCGEIIPSGRNYCQSCYSKRIIDYQEEKERYNIEAAEWMSLPYSAREAEHNAAERSVLKAISIFTWLIIIISMFFIMKAHFVDITTPYFWSIFGSISVISFILFNKYFGVLGKIIRVLVLGSLSGLLGGIILGLATNYLADYILTTKIPSTIPVTQFEDKVLKGLSEKDKMFIDHIYLRDTIKKKYYTLSQNYTSNKISNEKILKFLKRYNSYYANIYATKWSRIAAILGFILGMVFILKKELRGDFHAIGGPSAPRIPEP